MLIMFPSFIGWSSSSALGYESDALLIASAYCMMHRVTASKRPVFSIFSNIYENLSKSLDGE